MEGGWENLRKQFVLSSHTASGQDPTQKGSLFLLIWGSSQAFDKDVMWGITKQSDSSRHSDVIMNIGEDVWISRSFVCHGRIVHRNLCDAKTCFSNWSYLLKGLLLTRAAVSHMSSCCLSCEAIIPSNSCSLCVDEDHMSAVADLTRWPHAVRYESRESLGWHCACWPLQCSVNTVTVKNS